MGSQVTATGGDSSQHLQQQASRSRNTLIFGIATGFSRIAGLAREMVASVLYGTTPAAGIFAIAFLVPSLLRGLFADMALSAAFVPVFTDLLEQKKRREAILLASTIFLVMLIGLGFLIALAVLTAPIYMPLFSASEASVSQVDLLTGLTQVMLPTVLLLGLNGVLVGMLNAFDHFTVPALSPLIWNGVIIVANLALLPLFHGENEIYAQAIGVLIGTVAQLLVAVPVLRRYDVRLVPKINLRDPAVKQVFTLMLPVALSLGLINFNLMINAYLGGEVDRGAPRAIEAAFRLYMLPQGIFSVAIVTVLFPALSRAVSRGDRRELSELVASGMNQILLLLVPIGLLLAVPGFAHHSIELLFQYGGKWNTKSTEMTAEALSIFGLCLALNGASLLLSRALFALQRPWANTRLALVSLLVNAVVSIMLYSFLGVAGIVLGTFASNVVLVRVQIWSLRRTMEGQLDLSRVKNVLVPVLVASAVAYVVMTVVGELVDVPVRAITGEKNGVSSLQDVYRVPTLIAQLAAVFVAGVAVYSGILRGLNRPDVNDAMGRMNSIADSLRRLINRLTRGKFGATNRSEPENEVFRHRISLIAGIFVGPFRAIGRFFMGLIRSLVSSIIGDPEEGPDGTGPDGGRPANKPSGGPNSGSKPPAPDSAKPPAPPDAKESGDESLDFWQEPEIELSAPRGSGRRVRDLSTLGSDDGVDEEPDEIDSLASRSFTGDAGDDDDWAVDLVGTQLEPGSLTSDDPEPVDDEESVESVSWFDDAEELEVERLSMDEDRVRRARRPASRGVRLAPEDGGYIEAGPGPASTPEVADEDEPVTAEQLAEAIAFFEQHGQHLPRRPPPASPLVSESDQVLEPDAELPDSNELPREPIEFDEPLIEELQTPPAPPSENRNRRASENETEYPDADGVAHDELEPEEFLSDEISYEQFDDAQAVEDEFVDREPRTASGAVFDIETFDGGSPAAIPTSGEWSSSDDVKRLFDARQEALERLYERERVEDEIASGMSPEEREVQRLKRERERIERIQKASEERERRRMQREQERAERRNSRSRFKRKR